MSGRRRRWDRRSQRCCVKKRRQSHAILLAVGSVVKGVHAVKSGQADAFVYDDVVVLELALRETALRVDDRIARVVGKMRKLF